MSIEISNSLETKTESSWLPSTKSLVCGAVALGTIASVGLIAYNLSFPQADALEDSTTYNQCTSPGYIKDLSKSIVDLCNESSPFKFLCEGNLGYARSVMPQVNSSTLELFLSEKASQGISIAEESVNPISLIPAQSEMSVKSISGMIGSWVQGAWDPCKERILSAGGYVIDGHHRWAACSLLNRAMTILNIQDSAQNILSELSTFRGVFNLALGQSASS